MKQRGRTGVRGKDAGRCVECGSATLARGGLCPACTLRASGGIRRSPTEPQSPQPGQLPQSPGERTAADDRYITLRQLADYSGISYTTLRRYVYSEGLPAYQPVKHGNVFVKWSEFDAWMRKHRVKMPTPLSVDLEKIRELFAPGKSGRV